ncbi:MAG: bifunctional diaminohydroxyphosphoribosylaminopyrimidine deaminase/5-amino-6-(5-phosphoribosylamino)uracil reductase RibD [Planctomycetaceae bacterium]
MAPQAEPHDDEHWMSRALELATRGMGFVEPNPPVGAIIISQQGELIGQGFHEQFGGPHAEIQALNHAAGDVTGSTLYVTLEPCCHHGKTGPCTTAVISAGIARVVIGTRDPNPKVAGGGIAALQAAGLDVSVGLLEEQAKSLIAPFTKRVLSGLPWVHAKWAMTLDGKIASHTGHSQWISSKASREIVHQLRGRMDAIVVGAKTAEVDDPLLTARPSGPRVATRIVVDPHARLPLNSQLVKTAKSVSTILAVSEQADSERTAALSVHDVEILTIPSLPIKTTGQKQKLDLNFLLQELAARGMTHILVEGGGELLGSFFDADLVDEVHTFISPKIIGGEKAVSAISGKGKAIIPEQSELKDLEIRQLGVDVYIHGRYARHGET